MWWSRREGDDGTVGRSEHDQRWTPLKFLVSTLHTLVCDFVFWLNDEGDGSKILDSVIRPSSAPARCLFAHSSEVEDSNGGLERIPSHLIN